MQMKLLAFVSICHGISHETHYTNVVHAIIADLSQTEKYTSAVSQTWSFNGDFKHCR